MPSIRVKQSNLDILVTLSIATMETSNELKERVRASYNAIAPKHNDWTERHHKLRLKYLDQLLEICPQLTSSMDTSKKSVLELGCGSASPFLTVLLARAPLVQIYANELFNVQLYLARGSLANRVKLCSGGMNVGISTGFPHGCCCFVQHHTSATR